MSLGDAYGAREQTIVSNWGRKKVCCVYVQMLPSTADALETNFRTLATWQPR